MIAPTLQDPLPLSNIAQKFYQTFSSFVSKFFFINYINFVFEISDSGFKPNWNQNFYESKSLTAKYFPNKRNLI